MDGTPAIIVANVNVVPRVRVEHRFQADNITRRRGVAQLGDKVRFERLHVRLELVDCVLDIVLLSFVLWLEVLKDDRRIGADNAVVGVILGADALDRGQGDDQHLCKGLGPNRVVLCQVGKDAFRAKGMAPLNEPQALPVIVQSLQDARQDKVKVCGPLLEFQNLCAGLEEPDGGGVRQAADKFIRGVQQHSARCELVVVQGAQDDITDIRGAVLQRFVSLLGKLMAGLQLLHGQLHQAGVDFLPSQVCPDFGDI
mmetsp:Transcript_31381/g.89043  ORF Transcript_31381/g.89043 Transcript_31381/m.89043 type:complete len:255 (+) Transcript_31381:1066-1830(+)